MTKFDHAFDWVRRHVDDGPLPTAVLGIATSEGVVALDAFGAASVDDHYPLFSITKPIVGLAALRLIEQGRLTPETPLTRAIPSFGADRDDIVRLCHLASHTSGIIEPPLDTPRGLRTSLLEPGRDFPAGTVSRYSTIAFEGIAALIEDASGAPWERAVAEVGERADAAGITFDDVSPHAPVDAAEHGLDWARMAALRHPGAGLFARAADLLALGSALLRNDGSVVSPVAFEAMRRPLTAGLPKLEPYVESRGQDWGFTWNVRHSAPGLLARDTFGHGGWAGTEFWITPSLDVCFVFLTNVGGGIGRFGLDADELHNAVAAAA
ncbi:CubicO group peptidase (beta-lactamase class C family) [Agromyces flavus]|uniref:CubicO group peptidase (Beta-lactamase class C family) n=1 Tax=Agromyces flavus TaxID=589382 RepID=A0A1H1YBI9_9MICO|nr:serine hydrolase domain-containing protein [Agromyces flavus]MCP2366637.1 CubicO group peptidase (beta-lactamase class C family) [Agromyces flavus]GGI45074.1 serine hydrolase [Agromyces flavus]SDT18761.1 CubicO group peptidase, beta-lactamase class C family [Agromyces flavus]